MNDMLYYRDSIIVLQNAAFFMPLNPWLSTGDMLIWVISREPIQLTGGLVKK
jgi:hypothetical protein